MGTSGYFTDTSSTVDFEIGDTCANNVVVTAIGGGSNFATWANASLLLQVLVA
jgi:hypothetical protein